MTDVLIRRGGDTGQSKEKHVKTEEWSDTAVIQSMARLAINNHELGERGGADLSSDLQKEPTLPMT
jgi:hypothetical protein